MSLYRPIGWPALQQRGIPFEIRLCSNPVVGISEEGGAEEGTSKEKKRSENGPAWDRLILPIRMFARTVVLGTDEVLEDRYFLGRIKQRSRPMWWFDELPPTRRRIRFLF